MSHIYRHMNTESLKRYLRVGVANVDLAHEAARRLDTFGKLFDETLKEADQLRDGLLQAAFDLAKAAQTLAATRAYQTATGATASTCVSWVQMVQSGLIKQPMVPTVEYVGLDDMQA